MGGKLGRCVSTPGNASYIDDRSTGCLYVKLSQSSNVSKRVNCLSFQARIASSAVPICSTFACGTVEALVFCSRIASSTPGPR